MKKNKEMIDSLKKEHERLQEESRKAAQQWLDAYDEWSIGLTDDEKIAELRIQVKESRYVSGEFSKALLRKYDEIAAVMR